MTNDFNLPLEDLPKNNNWMPDYVKENLPLAITIQLRVAMTGISEELTLAKIMFWPGARPVYA
jgi:hypothetical protein